MNRFEKRKLKRNLYKHGNAIMYVTIFALASFITIAAAANRTDKVVYVDESSLISAEQESVAFNNTESNKVASTDAEAKTIKESNTQPAETDTTVQQESAQTQTEPIASAKVKVTADTLKVRAQASQDSDMLGMVDMDDVFEVVSQTGDWIEINYNGNTGYISAEFVETVE